MEPRVKAVVSTFALTLLTLAFVPKLHADVIIRNGFGPFCTTPDCGLPIAGENLGDQSEAVAFTPSANYTVTGAAAELINTFQNTTVNFFIYSNSAGLPGVSLGELGTATLAAGQQGEFSVGATDSISLVANTEYWLVLTPGDNLTAVLWDQGGLISVPYETSDSADISGWTSTGFPANSQFEVDGTRTVTTTATPEPASAWLLLTGFGLGGLMYRRRLNWSR